MPGAEAGAREVWTWGFSPRKQRLLRKFRPDAQVHALGAPERLPSGATVALWGAAAAPQGLPRHAPVLRVEDGFLRSVGLGADLVRPLSWVIDGQGIHYDPASPSALEALLNRPALPAPALQRAARLRQAIVHAGVTKYNLGARPWRRPSRARRVILVPGQVEHDASLRHGATTVRGNIALLQAARACEPDAYLVYKPHPDVLAGLRHAGPSEHEARRWCDEVVPRADMAQLLDVVDGVHVMTSLAGFEALLRGRPVTTHGMPFYAGWGLTTDRSVHGGASLRRQRRLALDELVAAALIDYPVYVGIDDGRVTTPERVLHDLQAWRRRQPDEPPWWRRGLRPMLALPALLRER